MADDKPNGGPAFPVLPEGAVRPWPAPKAHYGMTLRDYFAGQALAGLAHSIYSRPVYSGPDITAECYRLADAMLAEREKPCTTQPST